MKYAQAIMGLLVGTALGGAGVAATLTPPATTATAGTLDKEAVKQIVRETIMDEPQVIIDAVNKWQEDQQKKQQQSSQEVLKDKDVLAKVHDTTNAAFIGDAASTRTVVEFFDYNCPACKMQFGEIDKLHKADKGVKVIFKEYPIFGEQSETNSKIGLAIHRLYDDKYFPWHSKMMTHQGRADAKAALAYAKELGMDEAKITEESKSKAVADILEADRLLGNKLNLQGTPSLVIGNELVPHALSLEDLQAKLK